MSVKNETVIHPVMDVGNQNYKYGQSKNKKQKPAFKAACSRYALWIVGLIVGFIPATAIPLFGIFSGQYENAGAFFTALFCQSEILFMSVSLAISANNDASALKGKLLKFLWRMFALVLIAVGAMSFAILAIMENMKINISVNATTSFSVILFLVTLIGGSTPYVISIIENRNKN